MIEQRSIAPEGRLAEPFVEILGKHGDVHVGYTPTDLVFESEGCDRCGKPIQGDDARVFEMHTRFIPSRLGVTVGGSAITHTTLIRHHFIHHP